MKKTKMMEKAHSNVERQYYTAGLYEDILRRLNDQGITTETLSRNNIAGVDEFHVRGAEVSRELAEEMDLHGKKVLDVGCGLGGPARMLAADYNCEVTGIDLSSEFIRTAKALSELVGLQDRTHFIQADALNLPFEDHSFDVVWTQHVQMNISSKSKFYAEIGRVLKDGGTLIYYDIFRKNAQDVNYPVPWANDASLSFLGKTAEINQILGDLGFSKVTARDQTEKAIQFLEGLFEKIRLQGPPKLGLNVLMGDSTKEKLNNVLQGIKEEKIHLQSGIYKIEKNGKVSH